MNIFDKSGIRSIDFELTKSAVKSLQKEWMHFANNEISPYPDNKFKGRGIVICSGGIKYFTCAWIAVKIIRKWGCKLPIEIWYKGDELSPSSIKEMSEQNVFCKNILDYGDDSSHGWVLKPLSILHSNFKEIIYIDADNVCLSDPEALFEMEGYKETGALFWPDYWETAEDNPIWNIMKVPYRPMKEQESGQMVIHKEKCWKALNLCCYLNRMSHIYYKLLLGDKDTFRFAWMALNYPFQIIQKEPDTCGYFDENKDFMGHTMVQSTNTGHILFLHRNLLKWDLTRNNELVWKNIKRFKNDASVKEYFMEYSNRNYHPYVDVQGDLEILDLEEQLGKVENYCQEYLIDLRNKTFYNDLLIYSYLQAKRFRDSEFLLNA